MTHSSFRLIGVFLCAGILVLSINSRASAAAPAPQSAGGEQRGELQQARAQLKRDQDEAKRLREQLQRDRKARDQAAVQRDNDLLKDIQKKIKRDQDEIRGLSRQAPRGGGAGRRGR